MIDLESLESALGEYRKVKYDHPNKPEQWLSIEGEIDQIVKRFGGVAAYPELIALFVQKGRVFTSL